MKQQTIIIFGGVFLTCVRAQLDTFGIKELFPTKENSESWQSNFDVERTFDG
eukprot:Awhi_evm1s13477